MTRDEFCYGVTTWWELIDFCNDNRLYHIIENVVSSEVRDEWIDEMLVDMARNNSWYELYQTLSDYADENGYDYYIYDECYGTYRHADDDDLEDYKNEVIEAMDDNDDWDEEEEEIIEEESETNWCMYEDSNEDDDEEFDLSEDDECSMDMMMSSGIGCIQNLRDEEEERARQEDNAFEEFIW